MLSGKKDFFGRVSVRKILNQFWLSIREVFTSIRIRKYLQGLQIDHGFVNLELGKLNLTDETLLKNNFYARLEIIARGRYIHEPFPLEYFSIKNEKGRVK